MKVYYLTLVHLLILIQIRHGIVCFTILINIDHSNAPTIDFKFLNGGSGREPKEARNDGEFFLFVATGEADHGQQQQG